MDYKFLNKVVAQILSETTIDYDEERFLPPFSSIPSLSPNYSFPISSLSPFSPYPSFIIHCEEVYGLNKDEVEYIWKKYKKIIKDKIGNG